MSTVNATIRLMARPRVFLSSTYYGLEHVRDQLGTFIEQFGFETVRFELGQVPYDHQRPLDESCYDEVGKCDIFILVIGSRYGSAASDQGEGLSREAFESVTKREYKRAASTDIPIFIFVEKPVMEAYRTFEANKHSLEIEYPQVDDAQLLRFLAEIKAEPRNNPIQPFEHFDDIGHWLREQWAGLFQSMLSSRRQDKTLADMASQLTQLQVVTSTLKAYTEKLAEHQLEPEDVTALRDEEALITYRRVFRALDEHASIAVLSRDTQSPRFAVTSAIIAFDDNADVARHLGLGEAHKATDGGVYGSEPDTISADEFGVFCDIAREFFGSLVQPFGVNVDTLRRSPEFQATLVASRQQRRKGGDE